MALIRLEQILSNLRYNETTDQLILSGSATASFLISGSVNIVSTPTTTGSLTIQNIDSFGDSGSFFTLDLGDF
jgi:hypothetical protein